MTKLTRFKDFGVLEQRAYTSVNNTFRSEHDLPLETGEDRAGGEATKTFRTGTCSGTWAEAEDAYEIISIHNSSKGNGHFADAVQWFAHLARRDGKGLRVMHVSNERLRAHLQRKWDFSERGHDLQLQHKKLNRVLRDVHRDA
jgi:hypothetical protein